MLERERVRWEERKEKRERSEGERGREGGREGVNGQMRKRATEGGRGR